MLELQQKLIFGAHQLLSIKENICAGVLVFAHTQIFHVSAGVIIITPAE